MAALQCTRYIMRRKTGENFKFSTININTNYSINFNTNYSIKIHTNYSNNINTNNSGSSPEWSSR